MTSHNIKICAAPLQCPTGDRKQRSWQLPILIFMLITMIAINRIIGHNLISTEARAENNRPHGRRLRDEQSTASERLENETSGIIDELPPCSEILLKENADERCKYSQH